MQAVFFFKYAFKIWSIHWKQFLLHSNFFTRVARLLCSDWLSSIARAPMFTKHAAPLIEKMKNLELGQSDYKMLDALATCKRKGIIHTEMNICSKCTLPQAVLALHHLLSKILCSKWMGAVRMRVQTADKNPHHSSPSLNILWSE